MPFDPLRSATEQPDGPAYERAVLDALQGEVGFDVAFFATLGERVTTVALDAATFERAFAARTYDHELLPLKRHAFEARGVAVDTEVLGESAVRRRAYYRDLVAPLGGRHSLVAYVVLRGRPLGLVMLGRTGGAFSEKDVRLVESALAAIALGRASFYVPFVGDTPFETPRPSPVERAFDWMRGGRIVARVERDDETLLVRDRSGFREMIAVRDGAELVWSRAALGEPRRSGWFYVDLFHLAAARARLRKRALFIGCGGAVGVRQFAEVYPGIAIDLVDVDPAVIELARDWYELAAIPQLRVFVADGYDFVEGATSSCWDVVVVDAYDAADVPRRMASRSFFRHLRRVLRPGGAMAFNAIGALAGPGSVGRVEAAARAELDDVRLVPVLDPDESYAATAERNIVVLGSA